MPVELRRAFVAFDLNLASSSLQNVVTLRLPLYVKLADTVHAASCITALTQVVHEE